MKLETAKEILIELNRIAKARYNNLISASSNSPDLEQKIKDYIKAQSCHDALQLEILDFEHKIYLLKISGKSFSNELQNLKMVRRKFKNYEDEETLENLDDAILARIKRIKDSHQMIQENLELQHLSLSIELDRDIKELLDI